MTDYLFNHDGPFDEEAALQELADRAEAHNKRKQPTMTGPIQGKNARLVVQDAISTGHGSSP